MGIMGFLPLLICSPWACWQAQGMMGVSGDPATLALFHKLVHRDEHVHIGPWQTEERPGGRVRRRSVTYNLLLRGPAWFRRLCGAPLTHAERSRGPAIAH